MSIYLNVISKTHKDEWYYSYRREHYLLYAKSKTSVMPHKTLQGAYDLYVDVDQTQMVVAMEAVMGAESRFWEVHNSLVVPTASTGRAYLVEDIDDGQEQTYFTDPNYKIFYTRLGTVQSSHILRHVAVSKKVILDVTSAGLLSGIWMLDLPSEIGTMHKASTEIVA